MIIAFLRQYRLWYITYFLLTIGFLLSFWLYRLPLAYFIMAVLFNSLILLVVTALAFYQFQLQIRLVKTFRELQELSDLQSPVDKVYQGALADREQLATQTIYHSQELRKNQQDLIKMWAHQMKVPLSALSLMVQTKHLEPNEVEQQLLKVGNYVETLLNYLKFSDNKDDFRFEEIAVEAIAKDVVRKNRIFFLQKQIAVSVMGQWSLKSDKKWLTFALSQIIDNAIKYTPDGGRIQVVLDGSSIRVQDTGIGILAEDIPRLFDEGFTGFNGHEHQKASGLGLYMTKQILDQLGLSIAIESQVDIGTAVKIYKP